MTFNLTFKRTIFVTLYTQSHFDGGPQLSVTFIHVVQRSELYSTVGQLYKSSDNALFTDNCTRDNIKTHVEDSSSPTI
jgi:hypothetical protein